MAADSSLMERLSCTLFEDACGRATSSAKGIEVLSDREALVQRLNQDDPGQLGKISRLMVEADVNIEVV